MAATTYDILIEQGATYSQVITYKESGAAISLVGYTARMQVRSTLESAEALIELTTGQWPHCPRRQRRHDYAYHLGHRQRSPDRRARRLRS
jgi:hypothetical protein